MALVRERIRWGRRGLWQGLGHICPSPVLTSLWQPHLQVWRTTRTDISPAPQQGSSRPNMCDWFGHLSLRPPCKEGGGSLGRDSFNPAHLSRHLVLLQALHTQGFSQHEEEAGSVPMLRLLFRLLWGWCLSYTPLPAATYGLQSRKGRV